MTKEELDLFLGMLPQYCSHLKTNRKSVLAKIFGVFTIKTENMGQVYVMLMENTA
jgi:hypothetical protein